METTTKIALGVSALCCLATVAFAGGPEYAPHASMEGINVGLGGGFSNYAYKHYVLDAAVAIGGSTESRYNLSDNYNGFAPGGELGYTFEVGQVGLIGLRATYAFDDQYQTKPLDGFNAGAANFEDNVTIQQHYAAVVTGGVKLDAADAVYLEGGFSGMSLRQTLAPQGPNGSFNVGPVNAVRDVAGWVAGIGFRHYYAGNRVYSDVSYTYSSYRGTHGYFAWRANAVDMTPLWTDHPRRIVIQGVTATFNYLFQV